jgi:hypothetical protein
MDSLDFEQVIQEQIKRSTDMLIKKAEEYATDTDRLHNFKVASSMQGCTPAQALGGMMAKHTVSVYDMIRDDKPHSIAVWNEKITDHINYLLLLRAIVDEHQSDLDEAEQANLDAAVEKITDHINYLLLLRAIVDEHQSDLDEAEQANLDAAVEKINWDIPAPYDQAHRGVRAYDPSKMATMTAEVAVFKSRTEAEAIIDKMIELIEKYEVATVYDLYNLMDVTGTFTDQKWGWTDFTPAHVTRVRKGYMIDIPKPKPLPDHSSDPWLSAEDQPEVDSKAIDDQTALNDLAGHLARLSRKNQDNKRAFRATDLNEIYNIVERVRVIDPDTEKLIDE